MNEFERKPAVSGLFYPNKSDELLSTIKSLFLDQKFGPGSLPPSRDKGKIYGLVSPHAGYLYSGAVAANGFYEISSYSFDTVVILGPNHYGIGSDIATIEEGTWITPIGRVRIDADLAREISKNCDIVKLDSFAHSRDHCIEVQIPFLQYINKRLSIMPIILGKQDKSTIMTLGKCLAEITKDRNVMLIASSDLTHYAPNEEAHERDMKLISSILSINIPEFYSVLQNSRVTACGYGAIGTVMAAAKENGATTGKLLRYATSGDVTGDTGSVVGYSSIAFV
ncbi:MAG: MEMO1 family protein [Thermoproteota archaeon]|nr:MEMO1 family protein [Thermoproteota archaeon]